MTSTLHLDMSDELTDVVSIDVRFRRSKSGRQVVARSASHGKSKRRWRDMSV